MLNVNSVAANYTSLFAGSGAESADGSFADIFNNLKTSGSRTTVSDLLTAISEKFPNADVRETSVGKGTKGTEKAFGTEAGDYVGIDSTALSAMLDSTDIAKKVEEALSSFFGSAAGTNGVSGAYSQRSVSITVTTIRFQVSQRSSDTGETLTSQELQASLKDKIRELVEKFFGKSGTAEETDGETDETAKETAAAETKKTNADLWGDSNYSLTAWSMQLFYSNTYLQTLSDDASGQQGMMSSMSAAAFSASYQSFTGNFQSYANSYAPQTILSQLGQNNTISSNAALAQLLDGGLGLMGLTSGGFSQTTDGISLSLRNGLDFLSELFDLAGRLPAELTGFGEDGVGAAPEAPAEETAVAGI